MQLAIIEAVIDNHSRLSRVIEEIARKHVEAEKSEKDFKVFTTHAHMESFYIEADDTITVYFDYSHPYEGDETVTISPAEIEHF